ncbi:helix-turn-helix transcriptional regulator [Paenibacillus sp. FSL L8-0708]|uniref:helix-turn-helix domain-containing protein n=1 Tax=unclassified Paenibacillus TaxID=185978 RepID=UPI0030FA61B3
MPVEKKSNLFTRVGAEIVNNEIEDEVEQTYRIELRLHVALKERNLKQRDLARMTGIRPNAISNIYRGFPERLSIDHIERIAKALKITDIRELLVLVPEEDHDFWQLGKEGHIEDEE